MLGVVAVAAIVTAVVLAPRIGDAKRDNEVRERREAAALEAQRIRRLRALQRPRRARSAVTASRSAPAAIRTRRRRGVLRELAAAVVSDARSRGAPRVLRVDCEGAPGSPAPERDLGLNRVPLACVAVTGGLAAGAESTGVTTGYPYRAVADFRTGRLTWCRVAGQPGEGSLKRRRQVPLPAACTR